MEMDAVLGTYLLAATELESVTDTVRVNEPAPVPVLTVPDEIEWHWWCR